MSDSARPEAGASDPVTIPAEIESAIGRYGSESYSDGSRAAGRSLGAREYAHASLLDLRRVIAAALAAAPATPEPAAGGNEAPVLRATVEIYPDQSHTRLDFGDRIRFEPGSDAVLRAIKAPEDEYGARWGCPAARKVAPEPAAGGREHIARIIDRDAFRVNDPNYYGPDVNRAAFSARQRVALYKADAILAEARSTLSASTADGETAGDGEGWQDDPSADERWNAGLDFGMQQLCAVLDVDPMAVNWDAATETLDGDVRSVIGNIMALWAGDDWQDAPRSTLSASTADGETAGDGWLPIGTAPKDGNAILVANASLQGGFQQVVFWDDDKEIGADYRWSTSDGPNFHRGAFTHWRPLPTPPTPTRPDATAEDALRTDPPAGTDAPVREGPK